MVPVGDNYFTALNAAVLTPSATSQGVKSPMELSTYFRINAESAVRSSAL